MTSPAWLEEAPLAKLSVALVLAVPVLCALCKVALRQTPKDRHTERAQAEPGEMQVIRDLGFSSLPAGATPAERASNAADLGLFFAAERELESLDSESEVAIRTHRVLGKLRSAESLLAVDPLELAVSEENQEERLKWGVRLEDGALTFASVIEYDIDFVTGLAGRLEMTLQPEFDSNVVSVETVGKAEPADWVVRKIVHAKGIGSKSDDVVYVNFVNALDEPSRCTYSMYYTLEPGQTQVCGVDVPGVMEGHARNDSIFSILRLQPTRDGFSEFCAGTLELSPMVYRVCNLLPNWVLRRVARTWFQGGIGSFNTFLSESKALKELLPVSDRAKIYASIASCLDKSGGPSAEAAEPKSQKKRTVAKPSTTTCCCPWGS